MPYQNKVAVIGAGLTRFMRRALETPKELAFEAAKTALEDAGLTIDDIDCVVSVTAPEAFDGVHMKGEYLADGAGAFGKPYLRSYVGGGSGVFSLVTGWYHIASGHFDTCLVVAEEKMSTAMPHPQGAFNAIYDQFTERPLGVNLLWIFALEMNRYMQTYGVPMETFARVAQKNKRNGLDHPSSQPGIAGEFTIEQIMASEVMVWPVQRLMVSPISDGAGAMVLASERFARRLSKSPVWIEGVGWDLDTSYWTNRDLYYPRYVEKAARMAYEMAGITDPRRDIHVVEPYDPFAYNELHHLEGLLLADQGQAPRLVEQGFWDRDTETGIPASPSGGLLGVGNPISAAGLMKLAEIYWQLQGEAGLRQVKREVRRGLAQGWGDLMQVGTVVIMGK
ncbi:MAG TPA: thiolase domain-containing protein [Dehalococcoidia bacterium]|nr:thiolase domain-containing protein [Dehalococcoidia bacterium]